MCFHTPRVRTFVTSTFVLLSSLCVALDFAFGVDVSIGGPISLSSIVNKVSNSVGVPSYDAPPPFATSRPSTQVSKSPTALDMSPQFSDRLRYCVVLGRVVCESNFPLETSTDVTAEITQLQEDLVGYLGVPEAKEKIELCLFRDKGSYVQFISDVFPGAPLDRPALYVKEFGRPGVLMAPRDDRMILNIRHEMTHAYLNAALRNVPIWLDEGLAKYFEIPPGERCFRNPYLKNASEGVYGLFGAPPSLARLEKLTRVDQMRPREYRESWSWVHFMIHYSPETQRALSLYLKSLRPEAQEGISMQEAFKLQKKTPMKKALAKFVPDYEKNMSSISKIGTNDRKRTKNRVKPGSARRTFNEYESNERNC